MRNLFGSWAFFLISCALALLVAAGMDGRIGDASATAPAGSPRTGWLAALRELEAQPMVHLKATPSQGSRADLETGVRREKRRLADCQAMLEARSAVCLAPTILCSRGC